MRGNRTHELDEGDVVTPKVRHAEALQAPLSLRLYEEQRENGSERI